MLFEYNGRHLRQFNSCEFRKLNPRSEPCESKLPEMTKFALISRMGKVSEFMKSSPTPSQSTNAAEKLKLDECRLAMVKFIVQLLQLRDAELSNAISDEGILNTIEVGLK